MSNARTTTHVETRCQNCWAVIARTGDGQWTRLWDNQTECRTPGGHQPDPSDTHHWEG